MASLATQPSSIYARRRRRLKAFRMAVLIPLTLLYLMPLYAMAEFSTRGSGGAGRTLAAWRAIIHEPDLTSGVITSLKLAVITSVVMVALLLPTMIWVRLRLPQLTRLVEFICLLPLAIPAIVLVVGLGPVYARVSYLFGNSPLTLTFVYVVLALPYAYRALDASLASIDVRTLSEAARSLGASWPAVMFHIVIPNIRTGLLNAVLLSVSLVLGEFTLASLLNFQTLQTAIYLVGQTDPGVSIAVSLAALCFVFFLLTVLSVFDPRGKRSPQEETRKGRRFMIGVQ